MSGMRDGSVAFEGDVGAKGEQGEQTVQEPPSAANEIRTAGKVTMAANIPETIIRKLARIAGLVYVQGHRNGGGGLCLGITGVRQRRKALQILGAMVGQIGKESTDRAVLAAGAVWLDVVGWREDVEYAALWAAAVKVRREVAASRLEDELWDRSLNGYDNEEVRGGQPVVLRKFDNNLGVNLLKGLGYVGKDGVRSVKAVKGAPAPKSAPGVDGAPAEAEKVGPNVDTVLFADRKTAFAAMGLPHTTDGKG